MGRYLRTLKPTPPGRVVRVGPLPTEGRVEIDYATWYARLAGDNGPAVASPAGAARVVRLDRAGAGRAAA